MDHQLGVAVVEADHEEETSPDSQNGAAASAPSPSPAAPPFDPKAVKVLFKRVYIPKTKRTSCIYGVAYSSHLADIYKLDDVNLNPKPLNSNPQILVHPKP